MPYSAVAMLMILTTVLLSACEQTNLAALDDKSGNYYGRGAIARAVNSNAVFVPSFESSYVPPAAVDAVSAQELAPPTPAATTAPAISARGEPHSMQWNTTRSATMGWQWPVQGPVTAAFGKQREGIANEGITIAAAEHAPIHAAQAGEVAFVGHGVRDYGNMVILRHAGGDMTSYGHAARITVARGMTVAQGDVIGYVGQTGRAKTPQLHFAMRAGDHAVDPLSRLPSQVASR